MPNNFTPGPWTLLTVPTSIGSCHKIGPFPNGSRTATFACVYADGIRKGIDDELPAARELFANARLMAAAPDLLEALLNCAEVMQRDLNGLAVIQPELRCALAAIKKATGENP